MNSSATAAGGGNPAPLIAELCRQRGRYRYRRQEMKKLSAAATLLSATLCAPASATIIGGTVTGGTALGAGGTFVELTAALSNPFGPPDSVGNNNFQSPNLYGFDED